MTSGDASSGPNKTFNGSSGPLSRPHRHRAHPPVCRLFFYILCKTSRGDPSSLPVSQMTHAGLFILYEPNHLSERLSV